MQRSIDRSAPADRFPGWTVVGGAFVVLMITSGLGFYGLAVYLNAFSRQRGWDVATVSLATTVCFLVSGVTGLFVARLLITRDARQVVVAGGVIGAVALVLLGRAQQPWHLYVLYALYAVGLAFGGMVPVSTVITRWFHAKRSLALSVASSGLSVGGIVVTPVAKWLLDARGLEAGTPWLAVIWFVGIVPVTLLLLHSDPAAKGWLPDGVPVQPDTPAPVLTGTSFSVAVRTRLYWSITLGFILVMGSQVGGIQQLVRMMEERTNAATAGVATMVLAGMSVVARLLGGRVAHRVDLLKVTVVLATIQGVAMATMGFMNTSVGLLIVIMTFGATVGNLLMLQPLLVADRFGVKDYPRIFGRSQFLAVFGIAGGPLLLGWLHDVAGGYRTSYLVGGTLSLAGAFVVSRGIGAEAPS